MHACQQQHSSNTSGGQQKHTFSVNTSVLCRPQHHPSPYLLVQSRVLHECISTKKATDEPMRARPFRHSCRLSMHAANPCPSTKQTGFPAPGGCCRFLDSVSTQDIYTYCCTSLCCTLLPPFAATATLPPPATVQPCVCAPAPICRVPGPTPHWRAGRSLGSGSP